MSHRRAEPDAQSAPAVDLSSLLDESYRSLAHGTAFTDPADAYSGVPILKTPVWKNEVAAYFFLGGVSAGSALFGSLVEVYGGPAMRKLAHTAHYVSFATFLPCPALLIDDLGVPGKFHHMLRIFKPSSPMNLGSWAFAVHGAGATATVLRMLAADGKVPPFNRLFMLIPENVLAALGIPSSLLLAAYTGVLLGTTSIPVWYVSRLLGGLFTASSISTGAGAVALVRLATDNVERTGDSAAHAVQVAATGAALAAFVGYVASSGEASRALWQGKAGWLNWGAAAAMSLALVLSTVGRSARGARWARLVGTLAAVTGGAMLRWGIVFAGGTSARDREGTLKVMRARTGRRGWVPPTQPTGDGPLDWNAQSE